MASSSAVQRFQETSPIQKSVNGAAVSNRNNWNDGRASELRDQRRKTLTGPWAVQQRCSGVSNLQMQSGRLNSYSSHKVVRACCKNAPLKFLSILDDPLEVRGLYVILFSALQVLVDSRKSINSCLILWCP
jgi:hypothetical protein